MSRATFPVDVDALLAPIPGDHPAGVTIEYSADWDKIKSALKAVTEKENELIDDLRERARALRRDQKPEEAARVMVPARLVGLRVGLPEWAKVGAVAAALLEKTSKDLQVAIVLLE